MIGEGTPGETALDAARRLLASAGSLAGLASLSPKELSASRGVGPARAARILAALELARRLDGAPAADPPRLFHPADAYRHVAPRLRRQSQETFLVLLLDTRNRVTAERPISRGTLDASLVHPRDVFREAIREAAAGIVLAHNHPSGDPEPSPEDVALTRRLAEAGRLLSIPVVDHLVLGSAGYVSFVERGLLPASSGRP
ncbi:MAG: DNA repair protein RadC [Planctomycetales bacterium]|nr:DNA repair protein RadC [Planctomycetales bacterium]